MWGRLVFACKKCYKCIMCIVVYGIRVLWCPLTLHFFCIFEFIFYAYLSVHVGKVSIIFMQKRICVAAQKYCLWMYDSVHLFWVFYASFLHEWNKINVICCTNVLHRGISYFGYSFFIYFLCYIFFSPLYIHFFTQFFCTLIH